jgi:hypothetical protein
MNARTRDNLIYLATGLTLSGALAAYVFYFVLQDKDIPDLPLAEIWMVASAAVVFGYVLHDYRRYANSARFWAIFCLLVTCHFVGWTVFIKAIDSPSGLVLAIAIWPETLLVHLTMHAFISPKEG